MTVPKVQTASSLNSQGIDDIWHTINSYLSLTKENGFFIDKRSEQSGEILMESIESKLLDSFFGREEIKDQLEKVKKEIKNGSLSPYDAAEDLLGVYFGRRK